MPAATAATTIPEALEFKAGNRTAILLNTFTMLIYFLLLSYQAFNATTFVKKKSANAQTPPMNKKTFWMFNKRISCLYIISILKFFSMSELTYSFFSTYLSISYWIFHNHVNCFFLMSCKNVTVCRLSVLSKTNKRIWKFPSIWGLRRILTLNF